MNRHLCPSDQGRTCPNGDDCLVVGYQFNSATLPHLPATFKPDYGIERWERKTTLMPLGWFVAVLSVIAFVIAAYRTYF